MECKSQTNGLELNNKLSPGSNGVKTGRCAFKILNKIGQGGYGFVFTVEKTCGPDENTIYAMKVRFYCYVFYFIVTFVNCAPVLFP